MTAQDICRQAAELHQAGNLAEAERLYREVLTLAPDDFIAQHLLGVLYAQQGRKAEALDLMEGALRVRPDAPPALLNYGILLEEMGRTGEALAAFERAVAAKPDFTAALYNLGNVQRARGHFEEALASFDRLLALQPQSVEALNNRAGVLHELGRETEALQAYDAALAIRNDAAIWRNRGNLLRGTGRAQDALASFDKALAAGGGSAALWDDHGAALWDLRRPDAALASFDRATQADADFAPAWFHKATCHLLQGQLGQGWALWEWRRKLPAARHQEFSQQQWTGKEDLRGKTLFVWWEEGLGDTIMFFRYAALPKARGARVIVSVPDSLARLLRDADSGVDIIGAHAVPQSFDYHIPMLSLPLALGMDAIPASQSYLRAEPERVAAWRTRIGADELESGGFRIGVIWAATTVRALGRSFPLAGLENIAKLPGVRLISLQKRDGLGELGALPPGVKVESLEPFDAGSDAFIDTAAIMENLDLIISADTAPAHLAGALGRPVWLALPFAADWRWGLGPAGSWYPSARLFRQPAAGDWAGAFTEIRAALAAQRNAISAG